MKLRATIVKKNKLLNEFSETIELIKNTKKYGTLYSDG